MNAFDNNESYVGSQIKDELRQLYIDEVARVSLALKRPAYLNALTLAGGNAIDANMLHDAIPDVNINSVEKIEDQFHEMVKNGPVGMASYLGSLDQYITDYEYRPSGIGDPRCDGHFIGANMDFYGHVSRSTLLPPMKFVADNRFMKPGFTTVMALTYKKATLAIKQLNHAIMKSLYNAPGTPVKFYNIDAATDYVVQALSAANQYLQIRKLHSVEYKNGNQAAPMFYILLEIKKPIWAPECPDPETVMNREQDGTFKVGTFYLPGGPKSLEVVGGDIHGRNSISIDAEAEREILSLAEASLLTGADIDLIEYACTGAPLPSTTSIVGKRLLEIRRKVRIGAAPAVFKVISMLRSDWECFFRGAATAAA